MIRLAVLTVLAVLPAGGAAQRGDWPMPAKDYAATRYSDLTEITGANAGRLRPVWSFSTGVLGGHEGQPLVVDHTMYVVTPYPNVLYAFDLTREGYPLKWKYRPAVDPNALGIACCDAVNRGGFYADGKIVYNLLDGHTVAVGAASSAFTAGSRDSISRRAGSCGPPTTSVPIARSWRSREHSSRSTIGAPSWRSRAGQPTCGRTVVRRCGDGCPTIPTSTCSTTAPAIRRRTTPSSAPATTSGLPASWPAGRRTARWCGRTSSRHTTVGTTMPLRR